MLSKPQCGNSEWLLPANTQDTDLRCSCAQLCRAPTPDTAATPLDPAISWTLPLHAVAFLSSETHKWEHPNPYPPNGMFGCHIIRGLFTKQPRLEDASRQAAHLCNNSPGGRSRWRRSTRDVFSGALPDIAAVFCYFPQSSFAGAAGG